MEKIVEITDLEFSYPDRKSVLRDIGIHAFKGESVGIVGANGAGKTTLLFNLMGILQGSGSIRVCGLALGRKNRKEIRRRIGFVFQSPDDQLFSTTVFDDVAFGPLNAGLSPDDAGERVRKALAAVGMEGFEDRLPHHLSTGEKKRVAIASVLSMNPDILVMDEPTSDLDSGLRRKLIDLLGKIRKTTIIASHDLRLIVELCDRVYLLSSGTIQASGKPSSILSDREIMAAAGLEALL
ncbi:MAG: ABC transporter ATP-binding protein [Pseudomonadota bacterium]